ncbi:MAG: adenylate/guanylate cyclase domain-containing protein [Proteobacteria bacterium]|nr:adenylate/guanylate cyclase domain-containing protein [Pseudomonadota bacterium]
MTLGAISRATLNNYIALGILPKPVVKTPPPGGERARKIGYFPDDAVQRITAVQRYKDEGLSMLEIAELFAASDETNESGPTAAEDNLLHPVEAPALTEMRVTLASLRNAAYMVNYNFEIEWANAEATSGIFGLSDGFEPEIEARSFFKLALNSDVVAPCEDRKELLRFHLAIAKIRLPKRSLAKLSSHIGDEDLQLMQNLYDETEEMHLSPVATTRVNMAATESQPNWQDIYATVFREGVLFVHQSAEAPAESVLALLSRREQLIRNLVRNRQPVLTPLCVLVADLQDSVKICAELPPEEYFELINQIWSITEPLLRKYHATQGKHVGDGMVSYFFPQPDRNYLLNGFQSARELKQEMRQLSKEWQLRKNWTNELYLNIGLNEGEEWFGTYHSDTNLEFTVLGDTINHAGRLSDFARFGSIWATKNLMGKLSAEEREKISFGIRRTDRDGQEIRIPASYSRLANLIDLDEGKYEKFRDIGTLPITEVWDLKTDSNSGD